MDNNKQIIGASFRDPSGFIFKQGNIIYRQINQSYKDNYELLTSSGLYQKLLDQQLLIPHQEENSIKLSASGYKIIRPEFIPFISYPYEWSFGQLKDAALATLAIQKISLAHGLSLKDASAYNIQFYKGRPVLIDTLSFEKYELGKPWVAYRQFCQHFLAPLALMKYKDLRLGQLLRDFIDGLPLDLTVKLLPTKAKFNFSLLTHLYLHAASQKRYADKIAATPKRAMSQQALLAIIDNLETAVKKLNLPNTQTEWGEYYTFTNYSSTAFEHKKELVNQFLKEVKPRIVWDLGANDGLFSRLASDQGVFTVAFDIDLLAIEKNYRQAKKKKEKNLLPLFIDLTNPSPDLGWAHQERESLITRGPVDMVMALALVHHLAISNNLPLANIAQFFGQICKHLIVEFPPKSDSKVQKLLSSRLDIFDHYNQTEFEKSFSVYFDIKQSVRIKDSERQLYLMSKK